MNPFFSPFTGGYPPFHLIKFEHYEEAFLKGIEEQQQNIKTIVENPESPTFENVILAYDNSSPILDRVSGIFFALKEAETTEELTDLSIKIAPILSAHHDNILMDNGLYNKVKAVYEKRCSAKLTSEGERLLNKIYKTFVRSGAELCAADQAVLRDINSRIAVLELKFSDNILSENNSFKLYVNNKADLAGLPDWFVQSAAEEAAAASKKESLSTTQFGDGNTKGIPQDRWLFTLHAASRIPFLQYAENRTLRKKMYIAYVNRGNNGDEHDNKKVLADLLQLRLRKAKLLGYNCFSDYVLDENMAKDSKTVMKFLDGLWKSALVKAKAEADKLQQLMDEEGKGERLEPWDWWFYTEKLRKAEYDLDEEEVKPYFQLENVRDGAFLVAQKLYGVDFNKVDDIPVYHPDVMTFRVVERNSKKPLGIFYTDYFPRPGKQGGAWMDAFVGARRGVRPLIYNVCNFTKPVGDMPSLLTIDEVETLFHEFGHAQHGLFTQCEFAGTSGTNVVSDFVEVPSQMNEHWATHPLVLKQYAKHYKTGEAIPDTLIARIQKQKTFNQGFMTTELLAAAYLDMELHNLTEIPETFDVMAFEKETMLRYGLIREIQPRYSATNFNHIVGGYAAGYYSYLWANVIENDAFDAFEEHGVFDHDTAERYKHFILEAGDSEDPMALYIKFRGAPPNQDALLRNRGML